MADRDDLVDMTANVVSAYVAGNPVPSQDLPGLVRSVFSVFSEIANRPGGIQETSQEPAVPIKKSVTADFIICLEDGKKFKSLKRHLRTRYNMTPDEYRAKWGLAHDYPMVAPSYAKERSNLAKRMGLGHNRRSDI